MHARAGSCRVIPSWSADCSCDSAPYTRATKGAGCEGSSASGGPAGGAEPSYGGAEQGGGKDDRSQQCNEPADDSNNAKRSTRKKRDGARDDELWDNDEPSCRAKECGQRNRGIGHTGVGNARLFLHWLPA
jgi:hypothetical protein